jgi:metal-responsive CopG/Arc/MetJ family transcriptional regulator
MVVARTQTLVQLNDSLVAMLDERAARLGTSRSHLIREAIEAYLHDEREAEIDRAIVEGYTRIPPKQHDPWVDASARRSISDEPW